ncbi:MAG: hypothetical protein KDD51_10440 [Bdellovibrionales bacterium]|nr:hypothetical protein [Bdellovibrionales bacterium]
MDPKSNILRIEPADIRQGTLITIHFANTSEITNVTVSPLSNQSITPFTVPLVRQNESLVAQFTIDLAGAYQIQAGNEQRKLTVFKQEDLSFGTEFGLTAGLVLFFLFGVILWSQKKRRR